MTQAHEQQHRVTVDADFTEGTRQAMCSCGWNGEITRQSEHMAMAEWAAHVHVAKGWAVKDEDAS